MYGKRKVRGRNSSSSSISEHEIRSPDEKKARDTVSNVSSSSSLGCSSDDVVNVPGMAQDLGPEVDLILTRLSNIDEKLEQINSCVSNLENKLDKLDSRVKRREDDRSKTTDKIMELEAGVTELNTQVNELKSANEETKKECMEKCKLLEDKLRYAEVYSRRENLRFYGIEEVGEQVAALEVFQTILKRELKINSDEIAEIEVQRVHRVGKPKEDGSPRPIIAYYLSSLREREFIFSKSKLLKGTGFGISADFPPEIARLRKAQRKTLKDARKDGKLAYFSRVELDKLYIDGVLNPF